ncbi:MAG: phosphotransacetylase [Actinomycetota bacterium]|nr:phosphotransacetylase [Actinomycetota bacterium]
MTSPAGCPRCAGPVRPPDLWSSTWRCERHGAVHPFHVLPRAGHDIVTAVAAKSAVPMWAPRPLPPGWMVSGLGHAGDERTGARATAVALSGPSPLGGPADLLLVAEEPGVGLGSRYAGLDAPDPGLSPETPADARLTVAGHPTPLWSAPCTPDRVAFLGEAKGLWLWAVLWPADAGLLLLEPFELRDLREGGHDDLEYGAPSPHLSDPPAAWSGSQ